MWFSFEFYKSLYISNFFKSLQNCQKNQIIHKLYELFAEVGNTDLTKYSLDDLLLTLKNNRHLNSIFNYCSEFKLSKIFEAILKKKTFIRIYNDRKSRSIKEFRDFYLISYYLIRLLYVISSLKIYFYQIIFWRYAMCIIHVTIANQNYFHLVKWTAFQSLISAFWEHWIRGSA